MPEVKTLVVDLPAVPQRGDNIYLGRDGGQTYSVVEINYEIPEVMADEFVASPGRIVITITPKGLV